MITVLLIIVIMLGILSIYTEKRWLNPVSLFSVLWSTIILLSLKMKFNLLQTSNKIYIYILLGVISFIIGYYLVSFIFNFRSNQKKRQHQFSSNQYVLRKKIVYFCLIIDIIFFGVQAINNIPLLLEGGLSTVRETAQALDGNGLNGIANTFSILFAIPFSIVIQPIVAVSILKNFDKYLLSLDIMLIMFRVIADGGRAPILYLLLNIMFIYTLLNVRIKINKKYIYSFLVIGLFFIIYTTISRGSNLKTIYYYFSMEPYMFELWSNQVDSLQLTGYGLASFDGLFFLIFYLLKNIGLLSGFPIEWLNIHQVISWTDSQWQVITTTGTKANAYVSTFWFFYLDGRLLGIIFLSALFGIILALSYKKAIISYNDRALVMYGLLMQGLLFTFVRSPFSNLYYIIALMMSVLFYKKLGEHKNG